MGALVKALLRMTVLASFVIAVIVAILFILNLAVSTILIGVNNNVLNDIFAFVQIWLPFDINVILLWLITASVAYIGYRLAMIAYTWANRFTGGS